MAEESGRLQRRGIAVSIFEMDQKSNYLDPRKTAHILKTIFQYFYCLVIRIHQFLRCVIFYVSTFLSNEDFLQHFPQNSLLDLGSHGQLMFEYNLYPIYILLSQTNFIYIKSFSLLSSSNNASVDIVDEKGSFEFSPKAEFTSTLQQTLK